MLDVLHLLPNQYSWSTTSALAFAKAGFHVRFEPIVVRRRESGQSSQKLMRNGIRFLLIICGRRRCSAHCGSSSRCSCCSRGSRSSGICGPVAAGSPKLHLPPFDGDVLLGGLVLFFFGLISEQIAHLRFRSPESWLTVGPARR
jgi:hypothetical protein